LQYHLNCQEDRLTQQTVYRIKDDPAVQGPLWLFAGRDL
jgi:hypothetical protein